MEKLSVSLEDYIEEIYNQITNNGQAKVTAIAAAMNVKKASVTGALNALAEKKLINYAPYSEITLTEEGEKVAKKIVEKHVKLAEFFTLVLGAKQKEAVDIACKMEHIVPDRIFKNMMRLTAYFKNLNQDITQIYKR